MFRFIGIILLLTIVFAGIPMLIRNTANGKYSLEESISLYMLYPLSIFFLSYLLFCYESENPTIAYNSVSIYFIFTGLLLLTPIIVIKFFKTNYYDNKVSEFFIYITVLILSGLFGLILFFTQTKIPDGFLNLIFWKSLVIFAPLIPILIYVWFRDRR